MKKNIFKGNALISNWKNKLEKLKVAVNKKELKLIEIENLILDIQKEGLLKILLIKFGHEKEMKELGNIKIIDADLDFELKFNEILENTIKEKSVEMFKLNPLIFKLELYKPQLHKITCDELITWIYHVIIKEEKLKKDNKKQFYYLIFQFQKAKNIKEKQKILLDLLYKIQLYIKNAR